MTLSVAPRAPALDPRDGRPTPIAPGRGIAVNCRVLSAPGTGVRRAAEAVLERLPAGLERLAPSGSGRGPRGHWWEQAVLPGRARGLLWSPANTGPVAVRDQVVSIYDVATLDHPEWFRPAFAAWYRMFTPALARRVRRILVPSTFTRERVVERCGVDPSKVAVVPCGVDARFRPADPESVAAVRSRYALAGPYVLSLGTLEPRKNLARLFEAWRGLAPSRPDVTLAVAGASGAVFAGTGFDRLPPRVVGLGRVAEADLPALYAGAEAFAFPSLYEGFGLPPLEALACGTPVVASAATAIPEVVGRAGVLVDPHDAESIAEGLRRVLEDRTLREALARDGLARAGGLSWDVAAERTWRNLVEVREESEESRRRSHARRGRP
jgi:glycosyltransferase involved in cell wall biosynthesis